MNHGNSVFQHLMETYDDLTEAERKSPEGRMLFTEAMIHAPEQFKRIINEEAKKLGLIPDQPHGYDDAGNPLYSLDQLADRLGISNDEFETHVREFAETRENMGLPPLNLYGGTVHRVQ